jgi:hypothetical protein
MRLNSFRKQSGTNPNDEDTVFVKKSTEELTNMKLNNFSKWLIAALAALAAAHATANGHGRYEVWAIEQAHEHDEGEAVVESSGEEEIGGIIYIFTGKDANFANGSANEESFGLIEATEDAGFDHGEKPHMGLFNTGATHFIIGHASSGHVTAIEADSREVVDVAEPGGNSHAAIPSPDNNFVLVADIGGKAVHKIATDYSGGPENIFGAVTTLNLLDAGVDDAVGTPGDARPICPVVTDDSAYAYITLAAGGLAIIDTSDMSVVHTFSADPSLTAAHTDPGGATIAGQIGANGCGGIQVGDVMYINSGNNNPEHSDMVYAINNAQVDMAGDPAIYRMPQGGNDSHGMLVAGHYMWSCNRGSNTCNVHDVSVNPFEVTPCPAETGESPPAECADRQRIVNVIDLQGDVLGDPAPDLVDISPSGQIAFIAQRGPLPVSITGNGKKGMPVAHYPISNINDEGEEAADVHSVRVRK